jgi:SWI/SNF-related matrix-associated actin-dependent regulator of chromatin subfamily A member 5
MAPSQVLNSDTPSQADTPMTDATEDAVTSVPVDNVDAQMTVCLVSSLLRLWHLTFIDQIILMVLALQGYQDTPDYTVTAPKPIDSGGSNSLTTGNQESDTNPNTTASSVAGDAAPIDGRRRRSEAFQMRKSMFGKKHGRLDESKVGFCPASLYWYRHLHLALRIIGRRLYPKISLSSWPHRFVPPLHRNQP